MKNEDAMIIGLTIIVLIVGAIAMMVTGMMANVNTDTPVESSATYTNNWVNGVASTGTFVKNSAATWDVTGTNGIPTGWTVETANE